MMIDLKEVEAAASGQWGYILARLAPDLGDALARPKKHVPCPVHGGKDGFRLFDDYEQTGGGICNSCGPKAGGIALLMCVNQWTFKEALEAVAEVLGIESAKEDGWKPEATPKPAVDPDAERKKREAIKRVWGEAVPLSHKDAEPVRLYLLRRRLDYLELPNTLRCHPALPYYGADGKLLGKWPALVAAIMDNQGKPVSIHRTWLTKDGFKADVPKPKKVMAVPDSLTISGGSVWLSNEVNRSPVVAVTEGIETGLAVQMATGIPTVAAIAAIGMEKWEPFESSRLVLIFADKDAPKVVHGSRIKPGEEAARKLASRLWSKGRKARAYLPKMDVQRGESVDWADVFYHQGPRGFPDLSMENLRKEAMAA